MVQNDDYDDDTYNNLENKVCLNEVYSHVAEKLIFGHELCRLACDVRKSGVLNVTHHRWVDSFRRHSVTSQKTSVFSNTSLRTSHLEGSLCSRNGVLRGSVCALYGVDTRKCMF